MPSVMSESKPPQAPRTRTGTIFASGATPAMPSLLFAIAAMVPATWVPCQSEAVAFEPVKHWLSTVQLPASVGSESRPLPSLENADSAIKS